eukprot:8014919-Pyramimonas_sp.AAC.1
MPLVFFTVSRVLRRAWRLRLTDTTPLRASEGLIIGNCEVVFPPHTGIAVDLKGIPVDLTGITVDLTGVSVDVMRGAAHFLV